MDAVVACIIDRGYSGATAAEITRRSGLTWGAVQHHFGDKDGILAAVLEETFERFKTTLADGGGDLDLESRVRWFVERAWVHFGSPHYRTTFAILANLPKQPGNPWQARLLEAWSDFWHRCFPESRVPADRKRALMLYAIAVVTGLAGLQALHRGPLGTLEFELRWLGDTLLREIEGAGG